MAKQPKTVVVSVRMPIERREAIERAAVTAGTSVSAFVLSSVERAMDGGDVVINTPKPTRDEPGKELPVASGVSLSDPAALAELRRIGININQIAHSINSGLPQSAQRVVGAFREAFDALADPQAFKNKLADLKPLLAQAVAAETKSPVVALPMPGITPVAARPLPLPPTMTGWTLKPPQIEPPPPAAAQPQPIPEPRVVQPPVASPPTDAARRRALLATNNIKRPVKPPQPSNQDNTRDPPHPQTRHQLQGSAELRPARSGQPDGAASRLGLLRKLWDR